jgi:hypothetical protein
MHLILEDQVWVWRRYWATTVKVPPLATVTL